MKKMFLLALLIIGASCSKEGKYIQGPRGGCYYINSNGNKTYVDRGFCSLTEESIEIDGVVYFNED